MPDRITLLNKANNGGRPAISLPRGSTNTNTVRSSAPQSNKNGFITTQGGYGSSTEQVMATGFQQSHMSAPVGTSGVLEAYHIGRTLGQGAYATVRLCLDKRD